MVKENETINPALGKLGTRETELYARIKALCDFPSAYSKEDFVLLLKWLYTKLESLSIELPHRPNLSLQLLNARLEEHKQAGLIAKLDLSIEIDSSMGRLGWLTRNCTVRKKDLETYQFLGPLSRVPQGWVRHNACTDDMEKYLLGIILRQPISERIGEGWRPSRKELRDISLGGSDYGRVLTSEDLEELEKLNKEHKERNENEN